MRLRSLARYHLLMQGGKHHPGKQPKSDSKVISLVKPIGKHGDVLLRPKNQSLQSF